MMPCGGAGAAHTLRWSFRALAWGLLAHPAASQPGLQGGVLGSHATAQAAARPHHIGTDCVSDIVVRAQTTIRFSALAHLLGHVDGRLQDRLGLHLSDVCRSSRGGSNSVSRHGLMSRHGLVSRCDGAYLSGRPLALMWRPAWGTGAALGASSPHPAAPPARSAPGWRMPRRQPRRPSMGLDSCRPWILFFRMRTAFMSAGEQRRGWVVRGGASGAERRRLGRRRRHAGWAAANPTRRRSQPPALHAARTPPAPPGQHRYHRAGRHSRWPERPLISLASVSHSASSSAVPSWGRNSCRGGSSRRTVTAEWEHRNAMES